ncbi:MAG: cytochrome b5 [Desulfomonile tiedjei]|nr:cytochrome b5 [Desulfomonile tiedjei]
MKDYYPEQLAEQNGEGGKPALVAVNDKVYDVSGSKRWIRGSHMKRHQAGQDLTNEIQGAPHGLEVFERVLLVGNYVHRAEEPSAGLKGRIEAWLDRRPFFRRHPHPAVVHYPVGMLSAAPVFYVLALATGSSRTEWVAYCCLLVGLLTIPAAMVTGYFTWWINYDLVDSPIILMKRRLAWIALFVAPISFCVRTFLVVDPLRIGDSFVMFYLAATFILAGLATYIGFLGGKLTFPYSHN